MIGPIRRYKWVWLMYALVYPEFPSGLAASWWVLGLSVRDATYVLVPIGLLVVLPRRRALVAGRATHKIS